VALSGLIGRDLEPGNSEGGALRGYLGDLEVRKMKTKKKGGLKKGGHLPAPDDLSKRRGSQANCASKVYRE